MLPLLKFTLFGFNQSVSLYNLMIGIGLVVGFIILENTAKSLGISKSNHDTIMVIVAVSMLLGFVFAAIFDKAYHANNFQSFCSSLRKYTGMTFEGGLVGGILVFFITYIIVNKTTNDITKSLNCITPSVILAHFFGRIGCFLGGCCFGKPTDMPVGVCFPDGSLAAQVYGKGVKVFPTQLIEAGFLLIAFFIIRFLLMQHSFSCYLILYGIARFLIEFLRGDDRRTIIQTFISPSQVVSLMMLTSGIVIFYYGFKKRQKESGTGYLAK